MFRKYKIALIIFVTIAVISVSFATGCLVGFGTTKSGQRPDLDLINQAWDAVYQNYVNPDKLDSATLSQGAVKGIVDAIEDPYSAYLDPEAYKQYWDSLSGYFEGIGAQVTIDKDNQLVIVAPIEDSPAEKAGIKTGDVILSIDGESTMGLTLTEAVLKIRGSEGTIVTLTILHSDDVSPVDIEIVRAKINVDSVYWEMKEDVAYIRIAEFDQTTNDELNKVLALIDQDKTSGIILDLRSNPGGIVDIVVEVASHFVDEGVIITMVDNQGNEKSESVKPNGVSTDLPMVVLVDQYSASGSEVLAGALQDHERATIAGVQSYGKGSYNVSIPLVDGSGIVLTVGRWLTPNGNLIEGEGIEPDYVLTITGDEEIQWAVEYLHSLK